MFTRKMLWLSLGSLGLVAGCTSAVREGQARHLEPVLSIRDGASNARGKYELGRYYQGQQRFAAAIKAYEQALALDPGLYLAANNLGVIEAGQGRHEQAIARFRAALIARPDVAAIHNNLGYVLLLQQDYAEALIEFDTALRLEPGNVRAAANRQQVRHQLDLAAREAGQAQAVPQAEASPPLALPVADSQHEAQLDSRRDPPPDPTPFGLEISNGNGVTGMGLRLRSYLRSMGLAKARVTNERPFVREQTSIFYRSGFESSAQLLNSKLPQAVPLVESDGLRAGVDVRLLLGKDIVANASAADPAQRSGLAWLK